ncbi:DNA excision repair protein ERCC-6-like [Chamberlinius hualienensis]
MSFEEEQFQRYIARMKEYLKNQNVEEALRVAKKAYRIKTSEKLKKKIDKMETFLLEQENYSDGEDMMELGNGFYISKELGDELFPYQKEGILWMYGVFAKQKGGILADDMGLGKTIQSITFLTGLFDMEKISHALIVMPPTLINNWLEEFEKWSPSLFVCQYQGEQRSRQIALANFQRKGGILITTYGLVTTSSKELSSYRDREFVWDVIILDEGHKIKNPTKCRTAVNNIPAKVRIILTGTPIQNNLSELWSLFDYVHHGTLLGTHKTFKTEYETPITRSREKNATASERRYGEELARVLMDRVRPYLLRRTKAEVLNRSGKEQQSTVKDSKIPKPLVQKNDFVVWIPLTQDQVRIYMDFLHLDRVKEVLMTKRSPLVELTILKKLCDHPRLLPVAACSHLGLDGDERFVNDVDHGPKLRLDHVSDNTLINESGKLAFCLNLMRNFEKEGHRTLIFSQSRKMLDIIQRILENNKFRVCRLDGTITKQADRKRIIEKFESNHSYMALLLTVQVGGVGLNLTSADRVIIYDPSWNPATDSQAVDRAYRIGQTKAVIVYRLITCATVEEKIYRRQVFKESIYKETTGGCRNTYRYFTSFELKDMFTLENPDVSPTQMQLEKMHCHQRKTSTELDQHIATLYSFGIFGISDNDLLFSVKDEESDPINEEDANVIDSKKSRAAKLLQMECELTHKARIDQGLFKTPQLPADPVKRKAVKDKGVEWTTPGNFGATGDVGNLIKDFIKLGVAQPGESEKAKSKHEVIQLSPDPMEVKSFESPEIKLASDSDSSEMSKKTPDLFTKASSDFDISQNSKPNFYLTISPILSNCRTVSDQKNLDCPLVASTPMVSSRKGRLEIHKDTSVINLQGSYLSVRDKNLQEKQKFETLESLNLKQDSIYESDILMTDLEMRKSRTSTSSRDQLQHQEPSQLQEPSVIVLNESDSSVMSVKCLSEGKNKNESNESSERELGTRPDNKSNSNNESEAGSDNESEAGSDNESEVGSDNESEAGSGNGSETGSDNESEVGSGNGSDTGSDNETDSSRSVRSNLDEEALESDSENERLNESSGITIEETASENNSSLREMDTGPSSRSFASPPEVSMRDDAEEIIIASRHRRKSLMKRAVNRIYSDDED